MLDDRKAAILQAVVSEYIETAQPVGSTRISKAPGVDVSSATVRNEMASLETEGYLQQPHTSAGRVPTEKGYRYYVDSMKVPDHLSTAQSRSVAEFFTTAHRDLENLLESTSRLLSGLTAWTGVVVPPDHADSPIRSVHLVGLGGSHLLAVVVLGDATVEKHTIELTREVGEDRINAAAAHLAGAVVGSNRRAVPSSITETGDADTDLVTAAVLDQLRRDEADNRDVEVFVGGASRVASAFDAVEQVQEVLNVLEQQLVVVSLLEDVVNRGMQVAIGTETGMAPLSECSLVVAPYTVDGEPGGSIGVLGPTRMNYPEAVAAVAAVSRRLGRRLTEG